MNGAGGNTNDSGINTGLGVYSQQVDGSLILTYSGNALPYAGGLTVLGQQSIAALTVS